MYSILNDTLDTKLFVLKFEANGFPTKVYPLAAGFNVTATSLEGSDPEASKVTGSVELPLVVLL